MNSKRSSTSSSNHSLQSGGGFAVPANQSKDWGSNTQSNCQEFEIGVDWVQGTGVVSDLVQLFELLESHGDQYIIYQESPFTSGRKYANHAKSVRGSILAWTVTESGNYEYWICFPGKVLGYFDAYDIRLLIDSLKSLSCRFTRIDIKIDDYSKALDPQDICSACSVGNYSGFNIFDPRFPTKSGRYAGFTLYFGSPNSEKRVRYYDKSIESQGEIDSFRLEAQLRRSSADIVCDLIYQIDIASDDFLALYVDLLKNIVVGSIDFLDRSVDGDRKRIDRSERLPFWLNFLKRLDAYGIKVSPIRPKASLHKTVRWIGRQVQTSLALLNDVFGHNFHAFLAEQINLGRDRYSTYHRKLISLASYDGSRNYASIPIT